MGDNREDEAQKRGEGTNGEGETWIGGQAWVDRFQAGVQSVRAGGCRRLIRCRGGSRRWWGRGSEVSETAAREREKNRC